MSIQQEISLKDLLGQITAVSLLILFVERISRRFITFYNYRIMKKHWSWITDTETYHGQRASC